MDYNSEIERMKHLSGFGLKKESKFRPSSSNGSTLEYHVQAANGKHYAIIKECKNYYIKVSEPTNNIVTENFEYIGGVANKRNNCYTSYNQAYKQLEMKLKSISESCNTKPKKLVENYKPEDTSNISKQSINEMSQSLNRMFEILNNAGQIGKRHNSSKHGWLTIKEDKNSFMVNRPGDPESNSPSGATEETENQPFTKQTDKFDGTKDPKKCNKSKECVGQPYDDAVKEDTSSTRDVTGNTTKEDPKRSGDLVNTETGEKTQDVKCTGKAMDCKNNVATQKPSGAKAVKINEEFDISDDDIELEMNDDDDFEELSLELDDDADMGSIEPETDLGIEDDFADDDTASKLTDIISKLEDLVMNLDVEPGEEMDLDVEETPDGENVELDMTIEPETEMQPDDVQLDDTDDFVGESKEENVVHKEGDKWKVKGNKKGGSYNEKDGDWKADYNTKKDAESALKGYFANTNESKNGKTLYLVTEEGTVLNIFGDHPGYQKEPMTIPTPEIKNKPSTKDIDDESVKSTKPFGTSIGEGTPYEDKVKEITEAVIKGMMSVGNIQKLQKKK